MWRLPLKWLWQPCSGPVAGKARQADGVEYVHHGAGVTTASNKMAATTDHQETVAVDLGALLDAGEDAMVTLVAGKTKLVAHRAVLEAGSPVFAAMFHHDTVEASSGEVTIPDVEGPVLRQLLAFFYTCRVPKLSTMAPQLLAAADKYAVLALKDACEQQVADQLALDNAAAAAVLAVRHSCQGLRRAAIAFIRDHNFEVMATQGWADAVLHHPIDVVEVSRLLVEAPAETSTSATADSSATPATAPTLPHCDLTLMPDEATVSHLRSLPREETGRRLVQAAKEGAAQKVRVLLSAGVDVEAVDRDEPGITALHWAARRGHVEVAQCLVQAGAGLETKTTDSLSTPLHAAAGYGRTAVVRLLLASSADINARTKNGCTPLHSAAMFGHADVAAALLEAGSDRAARDRWGRTALDWARRNNPQHMIEILQ